MKKVIGTILVVFALFILSTCAVVTRANEYTLIKQFGEVVKVIDTPGLTFKAPFIQSTQRITKSKMLYDIAPSDVTTKDKKVMTVDAFAIWGIEDPLKYLSTLNATETNAQVRIGNTVYNSLKTVMSATNQDDIISGRDGELAEAISSNIGNSLSQYGIKLYAVETKKLDLPDTNKAAVYERMRAERENIAAQYEADAQYQYSIIKNETDREYREILAKAEAEAEEIKAQGDAQYMSILSSAYNDEAKADYYNYKRSLDAVEASLKGKGEKTLILSADSELARILSGN